MSNIQQISAAEIQSKKKRKKNKKKKTLVVESDDDSINSDDIYEFSMQRTNPTISNTKSQNLPSKELLSLYQGINSDSSMNNTIKEVLRRSTYNIEKISSCISRMWDEGLKYDDADEVLKELLAEENKGNITKTASSDQNETKNTAAWSLLASTRTTSPSSANPVEVVNQSKPLKSIDSTSTVVSQQSSNHVSESSYSNTPLSSSPSPSPSHNSLQSDGAGKDSAVAMTMSSDTNVSTQSNAQHAVNNKKDSSIHEKLEYIASQEDLFVALKSICEWCGADNALTSPDVVVANGPVASKIFFESKTLDILFSKIVLLQQQQQNENNSPTGPGLGKDLKMLLVDLFGLLFPSLDGTSTSNSSTSNSTSNSSTSNSFIQSFIQSMEELILFIIQVQKNYQLLQTNSNSFHLLKNRFINAVHQYYTIHNRYTLKGTDGYSIQQLNNEISQLNSFIESKVSKVSSSASSGTFKANTHTPLSTVVSEKVLQHMNNATSTDSNEMNDILSIVNEETWSGLNQLKEVLEFREMYNDKLKLQLQLKEKIESQSRFATLSLTATSPNSLFAVNNIHQKPICISGSHLDDITLESTVLADVNETRKSMDIQKSQALSAKSFFEQLSNEHERQLLPYKTEHVKRNEKYSNLRQQQLYLQNQLQLIESDIKQEEMHITHIGQIMMDIQLKYEAQLVQYTNSHKQLLTVIEKDHSVNVLLTKIHHLENILDSEILQLHQHVESTKSLKGVNGSADGSNNKDETDSYIYHDFQEYIAFELKAISLITKRIYLVKDKTTHLKREIIEYRNMDMQSLANEIELSVKRLQANVDEDLQALNGLQLCVIEMLQGVEKVTNDKLNRTAQVGYDANKKRVYPIAIQILLHCIGKILQSVDVSVDISLIPYLHIDLSNHINDTKSSSGNNSNNSNNAVSVSTPNGKANNTVTSKPPTHIPSGKAKGNKVTNTEVVKSEEVNPNTIDDPVTNNNAMNGKEDTISIDVPMEKRVRQSRGGGGGGQGAGAGVSDKRHDSPPPPQG